MSVFLQLLQRLYQQIWALRNLSAKTTNVHNLLSAFFLPQSTHYLWQCWAAGRISLPRENQARIDEVKQPASTQASPPRGPAGACWDLYHVEDKMKLSWVSKTRATEMAPQMVWDGKRQRQGGNISMWECVCKAYRQWQAGRKWKQSETQSGTGRAENWERLF